MRIATLAAAALAALIIGPLPASAQTLDDSVLAQWSLGDTFSARYRPRDQDNMVREENRRFTAREARRGPTLRGVFTPRYRVRDQDNEVRRENRRFTERAIRAR